MHRSEPSMTRDQAEAEVAQKPYPKVTKETIEEKIAHVEYVYPSRVTPHLTVCVITMTNGFSVLGKTAPASPKNFDEDVGKRYAYDDAFKQLWILEGYALREELHRHEALRGDLESGSRGSQSVTQ